MSTCGSLGSIYLLGKNYTMSAKMFKKTCDSGNAEDCTNLGRQYNEGKGVKKDLSKAMNLFKRACNSGDLKICLVVGDAYFNGKIYKKDYFKAAKYMKKSCDGGVGLACGLLGFMTEKGGYGIRKSINNAKDLYQKACSLNEKQGCAEYNRLNYQN